MKRNISFLGILLALFISVFGCKSVTQYPGIFNEDFGKGKLNLSRWEVTHDGDFAEAVVDVVDVSPGEDTDHRLRLRANTISTSDPLKYLGVRGKKMVVLKGSKVIMFDLDWNNQVNGSYLTASFYLCPTKSNNPKEESDWLKFEYVGVPPGQNVRINIRTKRDGVVYPLHTDWGPRDEQDRPLGKPLGLSSHRISIFLNVGSLKVVQDYEEIYSSSAHNLNFTRAYIYFQMSSGTNYPSREIYFDNIIVRSAALTIQLP